MGRIKSTQYVAGAACQRYLGIGCALFFHLLKDLCGLFIVIQRRFIVMFVRVKLMGIL